MVTIINNAFASQLQQLFGNVVQEKDLGPLRSMLEVLSVLHKDTLDHKDNTFYY